MRTILVHKDLGHENNSGTQGLCGMRAILVHKSFVAREQIWYTMTWWDENNSGTQGLCGMRTVWVQGLCGMRTILVHKDFACGMRANLVHNDLVA
eukprot:5743347-Amphidinium_carterae.1